MDMGSGLGDKMGESSQVHATFVHGGGVEPRGETTRRGRRQAREFLFFPLLPREAST